VFDAFLGDVEEGKTFYYGHSYSGNPVGCAAALASLDIFRDERVLENLSPKISFLSELLGRIGKDPGIYETRQCGLIAGIEVRRRNGETFPWQWRVGAKICLAARRHGILTRPVLDTIVFMPPLCVTVEEMEAGLQAIRAAIQEVLMQFDP
jgi:adenosylmethionine-8-amino-7-oxononanoate aminotransferase